MRAQLLDGKSTRTQGPKKLQATVVHDLLILLLTFQMRGYHYRKHCLIWYPSLLENLQGKKTLTLRFRGRCGGRRQSWKKRTPEYESNDLGVADQGQGPGTRSTDKDGTVVAPCSIIPGQFFWGVFDVYELAGWCPQWERANYDLLTPKPWTGAEKLMHHSGQWLTTSDQGKWPG
jgi:hypothetical protein